VTTYTFTGAVAYDRLGSSWRTAAGLRSVSVTDPATGLLPTNLIQGGVAVSWLTADANSRYSFTCDVPGVVVDFGAGAEALYANEVPGLAIAAGGVNGAAIDARMKWAPATAYTLGQQVLSPNSDVVKANVAHTSAAAYATDVAKWTLSNSLVYSAAGYASLSAAIAAIPDGATLLLPAGTYAAASIATNKNLTFVGHGPRTTIIASSGAFGNIASTLAGAVLRFRNIGFTGSTSACVLVSTAPSAAYFENCRFTDFLLYAIQSSGVSVYADQCEFDGKGAGVGTAIIVNNGAPVVRLRNSTLRYLLRGLSVTNAGGRTQDVKVTGCNIDGGWRYVKTSGGTGSGGTVTYSSTTVTDTGAAFSGIAVATPVRALAVKRAGTMTTIGVRRVTDSAANFTTAGVLSGDILRTSTQWGVVQSVVSSTVLDVEEWLTLSDYQPTGQPTTTTAYTVYGVLTGYITGSTSTVLTVNAWADTNGAASTPASGTLYEVIPKIDYQLFVQDVDAVTVTGNTIRRCLTDSVAASTGCRKVIITGNTISEGRDMGITVEDASGNAGTAALVANNRITRQATGGIFLGGYADALISENQIENAGMGVGTALGGIEIQGTSARVKVSDNTITRTVGNGLYAIHLSETITGADLSNNAYAGYTTNDIQIDGVGVTAVTGTFQHGTRLNLTASAVGPVGRFGGTGVPVVPASAGSVFYRTDGGAATSFYVKETASSSTTWAAK